MRSMRFKETRLYVYISSVHVGKFMTYSFPMILFL